MDAEGEEPLYARTWNGLFESEGAEGIPATVWRVTQTMMVDDCHLDEESHPKDFTEARGSLASGLTVREVALRYRVGPDKVRAWIRGGELPAINTAMALCAKPRWVIPPEALAKFESGRRAAPPAKPTPRRRKQSEIVDYYP